MAVMQNADAEVDKPIIASNRAHFTGWGILNMYSAIPIASRQRLASIQAEAVSLLIVPWALAHGFVASSSVEFKAHTADIKPAVLWTDGYISAGSALFMFAKLAFASFVRTAGGHKNQTNSGVARLSTGTDYFAERSDRREVASP